MFELNDLEQVLILPLLPHAVGKNKVSIKSFKYRLAAVSK